MDDLTETGISIRHKVDEAFSAYPMVSDGDKILAAVSGGKDSLTLLEFLKRAQISSSVKFDIVAAHITSDIHCGDDKTLKRLVVLFDEMQIQYATKHIAVIEHMQKTNCFWCSWNRRKALFELADELGCNKVAFGHHKDDIAETMLMNLIYNGEISAMNPYQPMFKGKLTIIRPLCYVEENLIKVFASENGYESVSCVCPFGNDTRRQFIKSFIERVGQTFPQIDLKSNIFKSISSI